jgi:ABC-2 type transport system permease protein
MKVSKYKSSWMDNFRYIIKDIYNVFLNEFKIIFKDRGVVIMFVLAPLAYPILYGCFYLNETLVDVPVAVVDCSRSQRSRELLRHIDATENVKIVSNFASLNEAKEAYNDKQVNGVIYIPADFNKKINSGDQTTVSIYCDISSFMYYRIISQACSYCVLDMGKEIEVERLNNIGITGASATIISDPIPYEGVILYNEGAGFASFILPAILMLIIHQTLFFGIGMIAGTSREENRFHVLVNPSVYRGSTFRVIIGKTMSYLSIYSAWSFFILEVIPHIFNLPHIGNPIDILLLIIPFLLSTILFSMTISVFLPNRETSMILFMFMSLILLFLSGVSWPQSNINGFWSTFSWIFPSTHGIQGFIKINTMGANLRNITFEYISLWTQTAIYFVTATGAYYWQINKSSKKLMNEMETEIC